jgi:membrane protein implicated in regulation of membrane protease activity
VLSTIFLIAAVVGGTVMVCQFVLTLVGIGQDGADGVSHPGAFGDHGQFGGDVHAGGDFPGGGADHAGGFHGADAGVPGDHHTTLSEVSDGGIHQPDSSWLFSVISFRTLVAAAAFFGATGKAAASAGLSGPASLTLALAAGLAAMYGMYWLMQMIYSLGSSGNERIGNALGRRATVYIPIPAEGRGAGKVQLTMQNRIVEFQAVTDEADRLKTGETVEVVAVAGSDLVRVRRVAEPVRA